MGGRSRSTRLASRLITNPTGTEVALPGARASSTRGEGRGRGRGFSRGRGDRGYRGSQFESRSGGYGGSRDYYSSRSQGGSCGDWSLGGSYRDSYDSYATHNE